ncbi:hypothetical protein NIES4073_33940 [Kalymmatonema gypsitolerans NIES-4073]|nr:hypothetical protein NIES4073_33940 [Scytonema sp. NIES-4073]
MNTHLVESLVQIIHSLSKEERALLDEKLKKTDWQTLRQQIINNAATVNARRGGKPFDPPIEEIIQQMREERDDQILRTCFPEMFLDSSASQKDK